eukprot:CAMPEP_0183722956 /NCGR_PEP_ID=MMETSP0737-20130205/14739_1 /TAXON_ID=385413 /ORGANISM="Thalassiosira miniscula, Strain CCMP1093" /LENGTH=1335 /DNA_ID=CAMNT_0025953203 /DNA_START=1208 /DNA_END=5215 /DNA_ORIENTATION=-
MEPIREVDDPEGGGLDGLADLLQLGEGGDEGSAQQQFSQAAMDDIIKGLQNSYAARGVLDANASNIEVNSYESNALSANDLFQKILGNEDEYAAPIRLEEPPPDNNLDGSYHNKKEEFEALASKASKLVAHHDESFWDDLAVYGDEKDHAHIVKRYKKLRSRDGKHNNNEGSSNDGDNDGDNDGTIKTTSKLLSKVKDYVIDMENRSEKEEFEALASKASKLVAKHDQNFWDDLAIYGDEKDYVHIVNRYQRHKKLRSREGKVKAENNEDKMTSQIVSQAKNYVVDMENQVSKLEFEALASKASKLVEPFDDQIWDDMAIYGDEKDFQRTVRRYQKRNSKDLLDASEVDMSTSDRDPSLEQASQMTNQLVNQFKDYVADIEHDLPINYRDEKDKFEALASKACALVVEQSQKKVQGKYYSDPIVKDDDWDEEEHYRALVQYGSATGEDLSWKNYDVDKTQIWHQVAVYGDDKDRSRALKKLRRMKREERRRSEKSNGTRSLYDNDDNSSRDSFSIIDDDIEFQSVDNTYKLASKTSKIMSKFKDYVADIDQDDIENECPPKISKKDSNDSLMKRNWNFPSSDDTEDDDNDDGEDELMDQVHKTLNLHNVSVSDEDLLEASFTRGSGSGRRSRGGGKRRGWYYTYPALHPKKCKRSVILVLVVALLFAVVDVIVISLKSRNNEAEEMMDSDLSDDASIISEPVQLPRNDTGEESLREPVEQEIPTDPDMEEHPEEIPEDNGEGASTTPPKDEPDQELPDNNDEGQTHEPSSLGDSNQELPDHENGEQAVVPNSDEGGEPSVEDPNQELSDHGNGEQAIVPYSDEVGGSSAENPSQELPDSGNGEQTIMHNSDEVAEASKENPSQELPDNDNGEQTSDAIAKTSTENPSQELPNNDNGEQTIKPEVINLGSPDVTEGDTESINLESSTSITDELDTSPQSTEMQSTNGRWFDRSAGWDGKTYMDAISFCAKQELSIPCPYETYCPSGEGNLPNGGHYDSVEAWAPILDIPNGWVQVGSYDQDSTSESCVKYNSVHGTHPLWGLSGKDEDLIPRIMCCKESEVGADLKDLNPTPTGSATTHLEQEVLDLYRPVWFEEKHGYLGTTHEHAADFCKSVGDMVLCPVEAYCPLEQSEEPSYYVDKKLFLQKEPFEGEQWAPAGTSFDEYVWVSIGKNPSTCSTNAPTHVFMDSLNVSDGSGPRLARNVMCCQNRVQLEVETRVRKELKPIWLHSGHGWNGGTHEDALEFCEGFGNRKLCPFTAYCPNGPGGPAMGGHTMDFNEEGEQWAPVYSANNQWVMIGRKYQNSLTTCFGSSNLGGATPGWAVKDPKQKKHIMCCSY